MNVNAEEMKTFLTFNYSKLTFSQKLHLGSLMPFCGVKQRIGSKHLLPKSANTPKLLSATKDKPEKIRLLSTLLLSYHIPPFGGHFADNKL